MLGHVDGLDNLFEAGGANPSGKMPENSLADGKGWGFAIKWARNITFFGPSGCTNASARILHDEQHN